MFMHRIGSRKITRLAPALLMALALGTSAAVWAAAPGPGAPAPAVQVDLNTAPVSELVEVPGIGQATAERIVAWREQNGAFRSVEDLMKVKGVGEKSLEKLRPYVKVAKAK
jgi:competence protein ComEA